MFNRDKYAAFPQEGNSLLEEIRLYNSTDDLKQAQKLTLQIQKKQQLFEVKSHDEITQEMDDLEQNNSNYNLRIRIVDNEGAIVKSSVKALRIIDTLVHYKIYSNVNMTRVKKDQDDYNNEYNFSIKRNNSLIKYDQAIDFSKNLDNIFHYHVSKSICIEYLTLNH